MRSSQSNVPGARLRSARRDIRQSVLCERDYYADLGIARSAAHADIQQAYRNQCLKYHPSTNSDPGSSDKFNQISEAYDVLNDPRKKATYDKFGEEGLKQGTPPESGGSGDWSSGYTYHGNADKVFRDFSGGDTPSSDAFPQGEEAKAGIGGRRVLKQGPPIERDLHLSLEDLFHGCTKKIPISKRVMSEDGQSSHIQDKLLSIDVQPGWKEGTTITFPKEGDQARGTVPADVVFVVKEKPHPRFTRQQDELTHTAHVCLEKALLGCAVEVETLDGRLLNIGIHELIDHKYTKVVPGEGMPLMRNPRLKGDLVIRFEIKSPKTLAADKKQLLKRALRV